MIRHQTRSLPVAFPGARGAYSQLAARRFFGERRSELTCSTPADALRAVAEGRASHAVFAVENSITGTHAGLAEAFFEGDVSVVGEVLLRVRHCVLGAPGTRLEDLSVVTGHPSSLTQCRDWLASWGLATRPSDDTTRAASDLAGSGDRALGVLGSKELAETYGLEALAEGIADHRDNRTRFFVLGEREAVSSEGTRFALQIGPVTAPRVLRTLRIQHESLGATRVRVPFLGAEDGRRFVVEFDHRAGSGRQVAEEACGNLLHRFLGAWTPGRRGFDG